MSKIFKFKISLEHLKITPHLNADDIDVILDIARKNDAIQIIEGKTYVFPEGVSNGYANRIDEILMESKETSQIEDTLTSIHLCRVLLSNLDFFINYAFGALPISETISSPLQLKSEISNFLNARRRIQDRYIDFHKLLLDLTIIEAKKSKSSKSPLIKYF